MSNAIKVGIWGTGRAGFKMHLPEMKNYPELFEIVAGCDTDPERCKAFEERIEAETYDNHEAFLASSKIELVSIATRSPDHVDHALQALETGKYVFLEKPVALCYADAQKLADAASAYPGKLFFRHNRRFEPGFVHIREIIASGILGDVYEVKLRRHNHQRRADWQTLIDCGGGQLNNWGPHIVDHSLQLLESPVAEIWSDLKLIAAVGDAEDHLKIVMKGENGRVVDMEISGGAAIPEPEYIIFGSKGALTCSGNTIHLKYIDPEQELSEIQASEENPPLKGGFGNAEPINWIEKDVDVAPEAGCDTHSIWKYLYEAIRHGAEFPIKVEEALEVVRVTEEVKQGTRFADVPKPRAPHVLEKHAAPASDR